MMKKLNVVITILFLIFMTTGCATVKGWFGKKEEVADKNVKPPLKIEGEPVVKFSDVNNLPATSARQYKKMTKQRLEEESEVHAQAGSMWVMDGQGAYLFAQNKSRREGDSLNVKIEGAAQKQIETKVAVIKKLLKQLEDEEKRAKELERLKQLKEAGGDQNTQQLADGSNAANRSPASAGTAPTAAPVPVAAEKEKEKEEEVKVESVPTRIVERQADGNYRIKGQYPFMIGKREYKVIVTGIVRPEDFNDEGINSSKLLDSQFDVVSLRRKDL